MILMKDIIKEGNPILRNISTPIKKPYTTELTHKLIEMMGFLINSQNPEMAEKYGLRAGVGLAAPQVGINERMFTILAYDFDNQLWLLPIVNPKIISKSKAITYLPGGEGCLSIERPTTGITPRYKSITIEGDILDMNDNSYQHKKIKLEGYIAIVFQHEYDHLDGKLYIDNLLDEQEAKKRGYEPLWTDEA